MIFRQWQQVLDGTKTQTRRLVKPGDRLMSFTTFEYPDDGSERIEHPGVYVQDANGRLRWWTGRTYAVQPGRGKRSLGRRRLLEIRREKLWDISIEDIKAEGVCPIVPDNLLFRLEWVSLWNSINNKKGTRHQDNPLVWALTFEKADEAGA